MKLRILVSSVLLSIPLAVTAAPRSESGRISFVGQIVEAGCAVEQAGHVRFTESQRLQVAPGVHVEVNTHRNACARGSMPLTATFEPLKSDGVGVVKTSEKGIVTISYL
jgi:type 1 fimbria pilin